MRTCFLFCFVFFWVSNSFGSESVRLSSSWKIVSDSVDQSIDKDKVVLEGNVKAFSSLVPVSGVLVGTGGSEIRTGGDGYFKLTVDVSDTLFYCYKRNWEEVYVVNPEFSAGHHIVLEVIMAQGQRNHVRKPVIYCYSEKHQDVEIEIFPTGNLTFTYPKYEDGWSLSVEGNEIEDRKTGQKYPYLFWEGEMEGLQFFTHNEQLLGWVIKTDTVISFLENQLTLLGLNQTEQTDFITFWGPVLQKEKYAFVQFLVDDEYDLISTMNINPKPESLRRVYLLTTSVQQEGPGLPVVPQEFTFFERKGFTVVEWGGSEIKLDYAN